jgi:hypothetical protein
MTRFLSGEIYGWSRRMAGLIGLICMGSTLSAAEPVSAEEGARLILNRWIEALGGPYELLELKSADYVCQIKFGDDLPPIPTYIRATANGLYRFDYTLPTYGLLIQAFDGQSAWQRNDTLGFGPLSMGEHFENLAAADFREPMRIGSRYPHRRRCPDEIVNGRLLQVVEMELKDGWKARWYFDPETGLRVRIAAQVGASPMVIEFFDFRRVHRVMEPYRILRTMGASKFEIVRKSILYNEPSDPMLFSPPGSRLQEHNEMERILRDSDTIMGNDHLGAVNTMVIKAVSVNTSAGVRTTSTTYKKRPNLMVRQQETPGFGVEWQGFDGKDGWVSNELQGYRTMAGAELQQTISGADLDEPLRLRRMSSMRRYLGETKEPDRTLVGIAMATAQGPVGNFYYDQQTALLARLETFVQAGASGQLKVVADFTDYRQVGGIKVPFKITLTNPAIRIVTDVESVELNVPLEDAFFEPRKEL